MDNDLKCLIKQRGSIKARVTQFKKYLASLQLVEPTDISKQQIVELQLKLSRLRELLNSYDDIQNKIDNLTSSDNIDVQYEERESLESAFCQVISSAQYILDQTQGFHSCQNSNPGSDKGSDQGSTKKSVVSKSQGMNMCTNIKLPTIQLPTFDGNHSKWLEYRDTFEALIHTNDSIPVINKFHYLRSSLQGGAAVVIRSIEFTATNYELAWKLVWDRFNNERILINNHMKALFNFEPIAKESYKSLRYMVDHFTKNLNSLDKLGEPTDKWDTMIIYMMAAKLDPSTGRKWEEYRSSSNSSPKLSFFLEFLRGQADMLETLQFNGNRGDTSKYDRSTHYKENKNTRSFFASSSSNSNECIVCNQGHLLYECDKFKSMSLDSKLLVVYKNNLCHNCLRAGHHHKRCRLGPCKVCKEKHNSLLHKDAVTNQNVLNIKADSSKNDSNANDSHANDTNTKNDTNSKSSTATASTVQIPVSLSATSSRQVLLCTAEVELVDMKNKRTYSARALLDAGSQSSFLAETMRKKMNIECSNTRSVSVCGINNATTNVNESCDLIVKSKVNSFQINVSCLVIPHITGLLPSLEVDTSRFTIPSNVVLADPSFHRPSDIHVLLGADVFWEIVGSSRIKLGRNNPTLQGSKLGWLVAGPTGGSVATKVQCNFAREILPVDIARFWEIEDISRDDKVLTKEHEFCETHFVQNTKRLPDGRFSVKLPLSQSPEAALGESYYSAKLRFLNLEMKLDRSSMKKEYAEFIHEYERLGHLTEVSRPPFGYYIPHHAVIRESSETTRLRVVFDASCKTSSGKSFNDIQLVGPVVQDDLLSILLRFRQDTYVVTGDIEKMYRQVMIDDSQRNLHLILWRDDKTLPLKTLQLNTVTYGTASAPYLSTRCLVQLADECADDDQAVANAIRHQMYVDDLNISSNSKSELKHLVQGVIRKLNEGCFPLRKFRTNAPDIFDDIVSTNQSQDFSKQSSVLGLKWTPDSDCLRFSADVEAPSKVTKRSILSTACRVFDPLGLLSPCSIIPKMLLQKLWLSKIDWDQQLPKGIEDSWQDFISGLHCITSIEVPRHVLCDEPTDIEIHCFTDASQNAYGACLYLRSTDSSGRVKVNLLCCKARVAPLKPEMTIPRMELLGALVGARLYAKVVNSLRINASRSIFWSDSTIVLGWLRTQPKTLKTFVCNRINEIRELTNQDSWRYISTDLNPADLASRGVKPQLLKYNMLYWHGPSFLTKPETYWPRDLGSNDVSLLPEIKTFKLNINESESNERVIDFERFSKLCKLIRAFAYVLRFISKQRVKGDFTLQELENSLTKLTKLSQQDSFAQDIHTLTTNKSLHSKSRIISLNPFIDDDGIIRVGGRIDQALHCHYDKKHPILIDAKHHFTKLLFESEHLRQLHCGPQLLLSLVRDKFWPTGGRRLARTTVNKCVICQRFKATTMQPLMGELPQPRVTPAPPFEVCGTDFAGPFLISSRKGRGAKTSKCYLCIFVCMATKAMHLEVVSDLSTNAFILCLRRFIARRGKPRTIFCDNGRNFVGARNELGRLLRACNREVGEFACGEGIEFKFSPAYSPNFGGIWEAGVKSAKFHLKRVAGGSSLTFEELTTLFAQIEAILNSRPLTPLSADPSDLRTLTPGHFLIGRPLTALPSPAAKATITKVTTRYELLERLRHQFWRRWTREYISELQSRFKWKKRQTRVQVGDVVLVKDDQVPVLKWILGRITKLYPGPDGVCRVVDLKTCKGDMRRAVSRLCPLQGGQDVNASTS